MINNSMLSHEEAKIAKDMLESPVFNKVIDSIFNRHVQELCNCPVGELTAAAHHASMKAIHELRSELKSVVSNAKMIDKRNK